MLTLSSVLHHIKGEVSKRQGFDMKILLIGGGGREHALAWKLKQSPLVEKIYVCPGNAGINELAEFVAAFCLEKGIDFVVIGPEAPLVNGLVDHLARYEIPAFGPSQYGAQLEGSKGFTKDLCAAYNIPTASYKRCFSLEEALAYLETNPAPIVIKADGLAAGKGVIVAMNQSEAEKGIHFMFEGGLGGAGSSIVLEEFLQGEEASFFVLTDGEFALPFGTAQDHKRAYDGDKGPNTGGMGAYSPAPIMSEVVIERTMQEIIYPTLKAMQARGNPYKGVLYAGLMIENGAPKLIEYNARFGDPECQVLMMRLESDLLPLLMATSLGGLAKQPVKWRDDAALTIVMAANGYPGDYEKGTFIENLGQNGSEDIIFHAGTALRGGKLVAQGGRVLNITATGKSVKEAQQRAYNRLEQVQWSAGFARKDIGWRAI
jgi:phosphoribosylamine---glycine ligase